MSYKYFDYIIVGGGLSGLSLAVELKKAGRLNDKTLLILDKRSRYCYDKTWCGWNVFSHGFESCVTKTWEKWEICSGGKTIAHHSEKYQYQYVPSEKFYDYCLSLIRESENITLMLESTVVQIEDLCVKTKKESISCEKVYDARNVNLNFDVLKSTSKYLAQLFYGWFVTTSVPVFDPEVVTLMDFFDDQSQAINFMYVLPFSSTHALIEPTFFFLDGSYIPTKEHCFLLAKKYMKKKYNCVEFEVVHEEGGLIPMMPVKRKKRGVGTGSGLMRPTSGYSFYAIQRCVKNIVLCDKEQSFSRVVMWMDKIFTQVCLEDPVSAVKLYLGMFQNSNPDAIIKFMTDDARFPDYFNIMYGMPKWRFIRVFVRSLFRRWPVLD